MNDFSEYKKGFSEIKFETLDGEYRAVTYKLIKRKVASQVYHNTIAAITQTIITAGSSLQPGSKGAMSLISSLDHDTIVWPLAQKLLNGCVIRHDPSNENVIEQIISIDESDWFDDNWDEFYLLIYHAWMANFPKSVARLRAKLGNLEDIGAKVAAVIGLPGSSTPSPKE